MVQSIVERIEFLPNQVADFEVIDFAVTGFRPNLLGTYPKEFLEG